MVRIGIFDEYPPICCHIFFVNVFLSEMSVRHKSAGARICFDFKLKFKNVWISCIFGLRVAFY